jgi:hypothetical protein
MKRRKNSLPFKVPWRIRIEYFLAPKGWLVKIGIVALIVLAGFGLIWISTITWKSFALRL